MTEVIAQQIAKLLNERNQLTRNYTAADVLSAADNYEYEVRDDKVVACVERKRLQWYQWEIRHLSVPEDWEGKGQASIVYQRAEHAAIKGGANVLQCTIREANKESVCFFEKRGFLKVGRFFNAANGNVVGIWQKVVSAVPSESV